MLETSSRADDDLALLYARGELEGQDAADFERRLGESQALRDTLCQAVGLLQVLSGRPTPGPGPAYRERVRYRLRQSHFRMPARQRPALWALVGAAAVLLLLFLLPPTISPCRRRAHQTPADQPAPPPTRKTVENTAEEEGRRVVRHEQDSSLGDDPPMVRH